MAKKLFLFLLSWCLISPVLADQQPDQQCPAIKINTLFPHLTVTAGYDLLILSEDNFSKLPESGKHRPILVKKADATAALWGYKNGRWQLTPLDTFTLALPPEWQDKQKVQVDPNNTDIFTLLEKGHTSSAFPEWNVAINDIDPSFSKKYLTLDNVVPYENHVTTHQLNQKDDVAIDDHNRNPDAPSTTTATVTLATCEYGLYASDLYLKLYPAGKPDNSTNRTLVTLTPKVPKTILVASLLNGNTGWTSQQRYFWSLPPIHFIVNYNPKPLYWFLCSHDNVNDPKCTWQSPQ